MRRTFPTLRLKNVIRLGTNVLMVCLLMSVSNAIARPTFVNATHHGTGGAPDTIYAQVCSGTSVNLDLSTLLQVSDVPGHVITYYWDTIFHNPLSDSPYYAPGVYDTPIDARTSLSRVSGIAPIYTTTSGLSGYSHSSTLFVPSSGLDSPSRAFFIDGSFTLSSYKWIRIIASSDDGVDTTNTTVIVYIRSYTRSESTLNPITSDYNQVHVGNSISLTDASINGRWSSASPGIATVDSITGTVYGVTPGSDVIHFRLGNTCYSGDTTFTLTVLTSTAPLVDRFSGATGNGYGVVGTSYMFTGTGFSSTPSENIVFFGAVPATVTAATSTSITVTIPSGAAYNRVTILNTNSHLTSYVNTPFTPMYDSSAFADSTLYQVQNPVTEIALPGGYGAAATGAKPYSVEYGDVDGDGKTDIIVCGTGLDDILIYRNISTPGSLSSSSFASPVSLATPTSADCINLKLADLDNDGKPEIVVLSSSTERILVYRNTSTGAGSVSFAPYFFVPSVLTLPSELALGDFNNDGRIDMAVISDGYLDIHGHAPGQLVVVENNYNQGTTASTLLSPSSFTVDTIYTFQDSLKAQPLSITAADFNGDNLLDLAVTDHVKRQVQVFQNQSSGGSIAFNVVGGGVLLSTAAGAGPMAAGPTYSSSTGADSAYDYGHLRTGYPNQVRAADFDLDGKPELICTVSDSDLLTTNRYNYVYIWPNTSTLGGAISFGSPNMIATGVPGTDSTSARGVAPVGISVYDVNNDKIPEIFVTNAGDATVSIIKNTTSGGALVNTISLFPQGFTSGTLTSTSLGGPIGITLGDLDSNTVPDIAVVSREMNTLTIMRMFPKPYATPIAGRDSVCVSGTDTLVSNHGASAKGYWSSTTGRAIVHASTMYADSSHGVVTGVSVGADTINYIVVKDYDTTYLAKFPVYVVASGAGSPITNAHQLCPGTTDTLADASGAGTWTTSDATISTIDASGIITGVGTGTDTVFFTPTNACLSRSYVLDTVSAAPMATPITGLDTILCTHAGASVGSPVALSNTTTGGVWSVTSTSVATVTSTGSLTGLTTGSDTVLYVVTAICGLKDTARYPVSVMDTTGISSTISGVTHAYVGHSTTLSASMTGGTWSSATPSVATISSTTGSPVTVTALSYGTSIISYSFGRVSCSPLLFDTVTYVSDTLPTSLIISGTDTLCSGASTTLTIGSTSGEWHSSNTAIATVDSTTGVVTGMTVAVPSLVYITYDIPTGSGTHFSDTFAMTVNPIPSAGVVATTADTVCAGNTATFTSTVLGGVWSSVYTTMATIDPASGIATGAAVTTHSVDTIKYVVTQHGCASPASATPFTVNPLPVAGTITAALNPICVNTPTTLTVTGASPVTGTWTSDGLSTVSPTGASTATVTALSTAGVSVIMFKVNSTYGCGSDSTTFNLTINGLPHPTITPGNITVCLHATRGETGSGTIGAAWRLTNANATLTSPGTISTSVTGQAVGIDTIIYTASGVCGNGSDSAIVTIAPLPDTGVITGPNNLCVGDSARFYDTSFTMTAYSVLGSHFTVTSTGFVSNPYNGDGSVTILGVSGGPATIRYIAVSASCGSDTISKTIGVYNQPNPGVLTPTNAHVCVGAQVELTTNGNSDYWYSGDTTLATLSDTSSTFSILVHGVNPGTVVVYNFDTSHGVCGVGYSTDTVTIEPLAPNPGVIQGVDSICFGLPLTLTDTTALGLARSGWSTSTPSVATIIAIGSDSIYVQTLNNGIATFIFADTNNCGVNATRFSVQVNKAPKVTNVTPQTVCDSLLFTFNPTFDSSLSSMAWLRNVVTGISNGVDSGLNSIGEYLHNTTGAAVVDTYYLTTSLHGCSTAQELPVTVNPTPHLSSPQYDTVCSGSLFTYQDVETTGPTTGAVWTRLQANGVYLSNGSNSGSHTINEILKDTVQLVGSTFYTYTLSLNGCTSTEKVFVTVDPTATAPSITQHSLATVCSQTMYQNFGAAIAPVAPATYSWYGSNGAEVWATGDTRQYALVNFTKPGDTYVYLEATLQGYNCPIKDSFNVNVSNSESDFPQVIYFNGDFVCLSNVEDSYQWGKDDVGTLDSTAFPNQTNQNYTNTNPDFTHDYYWVITNHSGCMQKTYYIVPTGIKNVTATMGDMNVYPNPATQMVNVEISNTSGGKYKVELMNMLGQKVQEQDIAGTKTTFDIANLSAGVYFIDCYRDGVKFATSKFVKN